MGKITFIVGGARSGKSAYAVSMAKAARKCAFVATCEARDDEMKRRIKLHKSSRPEGWTTFEEPLSIAALIRKIPAAHDFILIDCLTLLVTNLLLKKRSAKAIENEARAVLKALKARKGTSVIVSNEVGLGIVPDNRLGRDFRDIAGRINALVAGKAYRVFFMVSGIPWRIK